ncbi:MAG: cytochrome c [Bdellovibrionales bacterium]|nr:cytochrome c [Bdellovibrionales bacterium]
MDSNQINRGPIKNHLNASSGRKKVALAVEIMLALILIGLTIQFFRQFKSSEECGENEYHSSYTERCEPIVILLGNDVETISFAVEALKKKFEVKEMVVSTNPAYKGSGKEAVRRKYRGFDFSEIIKFLSNGKELKEIVASITCLDGFDPTIRYDILKKLISTKAILAFEQFDIEENGNPKSKDGKWELLNAPWGLASPGPFYLVWGDLDGTYWQGWPFQVKSIRVLLSKDYDQMLAKLRPEERFMGQDPKTDVEKGYDQFRGKCLTCHNINGIGGQKSKSDLLARAKGFENVERFAFFVKATIANPSPGMSDIRDVKFSEGDQEAIAHYLWHMSESP